jgi:beta-glucosidase/6-phospho-beta-glucosidase/beta-galactosidase
MANFMFATGIENSYPTIQNGRHRVDQMEVCGHYKHWRTDFDLVEDLGIRFLRYGPPIHLTWLADGRYDWSFSDETFGDLKRRDLNVIVDLCHFGVPDWVANFRTRFPQFSQSYARAFAGAFPGSSLHADQQMFVCANFSALMRLVERAAIERPGLYHLLEHLVKGQVLAMQAILEVRRMPCSSRASRRSMYFHAENRHAIKPRALLNSRRFPVARPELPRHAVSIRRCTNT